MTDHILRLDFSVFLLLVFVTFSAQFSTNASAQEEKPDRYALLVAVTKYQHSSMNRPALRYPEADAKSIGKFLEQHGYKVDYLLGSEATKASVEKKIDNLANIGNASGVCLVGFWGHGVEYQDEKLVKESMFCPFDSKIRRVVDSQGNKLLDRRGKDLLEPDPDTLVGMAKVLGGLRLCGSGNKLIIADCCRNTPNRARGRSIGFGGSVTLNDLPENTAAIFACKSDQQAFEHEDWKHGAFSKALLDLLPELVARNETSITSMLSPLRRNVSRLVREATDGRNQQNIHPILNGFPDLKLVGPRRKLINKYGMELRLIPAGEFMMGSSKSPAEIARMFDSKASYFEDEHPRHRVSISRSFYMGAHEVTVGQFRKFVSDTGYKTEAESDGKGGYGLNDEGSKFVQDPKNTWKNPGFNQTDDHPVVNVSWNDATKYCQWLSKETGEEYRLPTEAEWEYACRAESTTLFHSGNDAEELIRVGNVADGTAKLKFENWQTIKSKDGYVFTAPVGSYEANSFGLHDMHGNVWEWCSDRYGKDYYSNSPSADPRGPASGSDRVNRGGGWNRTPPYCRSANRDGDSPDDRSDNLGFRVVRSSE